mmetsp:Transcript_28540/g.68648  ORF Transcript_28540/g.68648 Transcript_28540/m.68648 type:complete len:119 (-) Transcript_28540:91-447(-)
MVSRVPDLPGTEALVGELRKLEGELEVAEKRGKALQAEIKASLKRQESMKQELVQTTAAAQIATRGVNPLLENDSGHWPVQQDAFGRSSQMIDRSDQERCCWKKSKPANDPASELGGF